MVLSPQLSTGSSIYQRTSRSKPSFESSLSDVGVLALRAEVEGAEKANKTVAIKFEPKRED